MRTVTEKSFDPETRLLTCDVSDGVNTIEVARHVPASIYTQFDGMENEGELIVDAIDKYKSAYIAGLEVEPFTGLAKPEFDEVE